MYTMIENVDPQVHDAFVIRYPYCNLLQSSKWAQVKENWKHVILGVENEKQQLVASALCLIKPLPLGFTMFYIPRGPVLDYNNKELVNYTIAGIRKYAKQHRCVMVKLDPPVHKDDFYLEDHKDRISKEAETARNNLVSAGAIHQGFHLELDATIQPRFHANVMKCDDFQEQLPKHTRRHIQTAIKKHVTVQRGHQEYLDDFVHLLKLTEQRQGIKLRDASYFQLIMDTYQEDAMLFLAYLDIKSLVEDTKKRYDKEVSNLSKAAENKKDALEKTVKQIEDELSFLQKTAGENERIPVAGALCVKFGPTMEMLYMGSDTDYRKYMAPYLSHVTPMNWAFAHGCTSCNMGGIAGTLDDGLTKFKSNFHPLINEYMGEFDVPVNRAFYYMASKALQIRKKRRGHEPS